MGVRGEDVFAAGQPRPHDDRSTSAFPVALLPRCGQQCQQLVAQVSQGVGCGRVFLDQVCQAGLPGGQQSLAHLVTLLWWGLFHLGRQGIQPPLGDRCAFLVGAMICHCRRLGFVASWADGRTGAAWKVWCPPRPADCRWLRLVSGNDHAPAES
jgi:hypothetical protein